MEAGSGRDYGGALQRSEIGIHDLWLAKQGEFEAVPHKEEASGGAYELIKVRTSRPLGKPREIAMG